MKYANLTPYFITTPNSLDLPCVDIVDETYDAYLVEDKQGVGILMPGVAKKPYYVDFESPELRRRLLQVKRELLVRACWVKPDAYIVDATAGFGRDSFILAAAGAQVLMMERDSVIAFLLQDGLSRMNDEVVKQRLTLQQGESIQLLQSLMKKPDVIYLDPMFESFSRQAKVKKDLQLLQQMLEDVQQDQSYLLPAALEVAVHRVVVKRAIHAAPLNQLQPTYRLLGKDSRFDIYQISR